jgi:hypothetical protein
MACLFCSQNQQQQQGQQANFYPHTDTNTDIDTDTDADTAHERYTPYAIVAAGVAFYVFSFLPCNSTGGGGGFTSPPSV